MSIVIDIHALQTVPPSLINRDDTGAPKSAIFGGVPRQRVSSQSWKRAIRRYFEENFDAQQIGDRSKRLPEKIAQRLIDAGVEQDEAIKRVEDLFKAAGIKTAIEKPKKNDDSEEKPSPYPRTGYLLFLSQQQIDRAVEELLARDGEKPSKAEAKAILDTDHSVDMAMFGRMVADDAAYNVDASVQVAHAIGIHGSTPDFDYFTAVDDLAEEGEETGAGMIGTVQMMSSTMYRYATINFDGLRKNLDSVDTARLAAEHFIEAFVSSMPTGKINTFANQTLPELVYVAVRDTRPISLVNAFEVPVEAKQGASRRKVASDRLAQEARDVESVYGFKPLAAYVMGIGETADSFAELAEKTTLQELTQNINEVLERVVGDQ
ncbi:type I-E CRISPR-associated protein Cas7/Cse4/CasC [Corynebacterium lujinxingii]|uniref:Type I-E CRISPR-associated protein Cas7/Cse4/CasC n=1 Tax=Corynebacterium lujinxingii TaxID=2763010 RepID=A0A7H0JYS4_9CORY|nr:type I-E CRISPR-associated protein Cas7/Cse4/CasC [Corynebacterium lujinxingii]MBC3179747.1 type I-E CRISPR-associated protein Cas7/Cse4/CasC [Corynebacterium lujinxingii]NNO11675.1 type I-E CRISPR-associated protein Cas7/Cse4/CasC [Corynebacterium lujinxingii]QNP90190.1 type I-E CRISPR-associated protein Cas7/Cse4/CasC [Corynebacterium lujinxingii]